MFLLTKALRLDLRPTKPPIKLVPGALFWVYDDWSVNLIDHSSPPNVVGPVHPAVMLTRSIMRK